MMTTVTIKADKFKVEIDKWNHTLYEYTKGSIIPAGKKKGEMSEDKWKFVGYYPNMGQCLNKVASIEIHSGNMDLDLLQYVDLCRTKLNEVYEEAKI